MVQVGRPVGVQSLEQSALEWYGQDPRYGVGRRECQWVEPQLQASVPDYALHTATLRHTETLTYQTSTVTPRYSLRHMRLHIGHALSY